MKSRNGVDQLHGDAHLHPVLPDAASSTAPTLSLCAMSQRICPRELLNSLARIRICSRCAHIFVSFKRKS